MTLPNVNDPQVKKDIEENKVVAAIGYISILCLIPLLLKPKSQFCKFHGKQGLILLIAGFINMVIGIIPVIGWILGFIGAIAIIILSILGILKSLNGEYWEMPYVAEYAKKINI
ncbi:MAG: hypothetical protein A2Y67_00465 [Candidatus Buchananbacteria bacterium RBG_13_39_9]|jgi:uncharacterized membrane protein|uniref:Chloroplast import component protein (Tic20) n=1 Tax=Candidatus Buchananbacteria bacterium RBG_13_39_9 TaxID=1797531 RepID=A0A1G1XNL0_9BACT|nr:MAG: hypothetical protein A2Y67_00465 [Candidatus Buchananbacteria bacterium RBG_13_39_9]